MPRPVQRLGRLRPWRAMHFLERNKLGGDHLSFDQQKRSYPFEIPIASASPECRHRCGRARSVAAFVSSKWTTASFELLISGLPL